MRMCQIVGTSQQVAIRSETVAIREVVVRRVTTNNGVIQMLSGSQREGFRLNGSIRYLNRYHNRSHSCLQMDCVVNGRIWSTYVEILSEVKLFVIGRI